MRFRDLGSNQSQDSRKGEVAMNDLTKFLIKAYLRKFLAILGTYLLTHGILTSGTSNDFVNTYLEPAFGAILVGISAVWTWVYQQYVKRKVTTALELPEGSSPAKLEKALKEEELPSLDEVTGGKSKRGKK